MKNLTYGMSSIEDKFWASEVKCVDCSKSDKRNKMSVRRTSRNQEVVVCNKCAGKYRKAKEEVQEMMKEDQDSLRAIRTDRNWERQSESNFNENIQENTLQLV